MRGPSQPENAAKTMLDLGHEVTGDLCRRVWIEIEVTAVDGCQRRDIHHRVLGRPVAMAGRNTLPGMAASVVFEVSTAYQVV